VPTANCMSDLDHARQMLGIAKRDLKALGGMLDSDVFAYEIFGFHAQQTAEKALKAWISALGDDCGFPEREEVLDKVASLLEQVERIIVEV
jgi:HEPN domain-containing protein